YYSWSFANKTGLSNVNLNAEYYNLIDFYEEYYYMSEEVLDYVESVKDSDAKLYADFNAYMDGEKQILGLTEPE
ncbi:MAG: hypothetical protein K2I79_00305, partial [Clostridia bacterium]|nr:hypothetical protein [Clostridia bacterium]